MTAEIFALGQAGIPARDGADWAAPAVRTVRDRVRQVILYEVGGLLVIGPLFSMAAGVPVQESALLLTVMAVAFAPWTGIYSALFDRAEALWRRRAADQRPPALRLLHAVGLEATVSVMSIPMIAAWTGVGLSTAFVEDAGLTVAYAAWAFLFGIAYDRMFPIEARRGG